MMVRRSSNGCPSLGRVLSGWKPGGREVKARTVLTTRSLKGKDVGASLPGRRVGTTDEH